MSLNDARIDPENRDARLGRKTFPEEKAIHDEVKANAVKACKPLIEMFANCDREQGLMVIFNCRKENKAMNDCMRDLMTPDHIAAMRQLRVDRMMKQKEEDEAKAKAEEKKAKGGWFS
mmetsp:Transcript_52790/g.123668  ORF Transcript_52790/g.123668 Transcript_52790/m.123668 type:complete len:118 (+) Transcript_52790:90-443(+)